jgi:photosystem II stability/assembly factor-like uncharacterized protein
VKREILAGLILLVSACGPAPDARSPSGTTAGKAGASAAAPEDPAAAAKRDEILAKYVAARGGADKLRALGSLRLTGSARFGDGDGAIEATYGLAVKRPGRAREEASFQGLTGVDAYDGTEGWSVEPWGGRRDAFHKSQDEAKELAHTADIEGPLVDWRQKGHAVDYLGTEEIDGTLAHKMRVRMKDGDVQYHYIDPDAYLVFRVVSERRIRGALSVREVDLGDYEEVAGVFVPFSIEAGAKGHPRSARVTIERGEANVPLDDALFKFPAANAKVARAIQPGPGAAAEPPKAPQAAAGAAPLFDSGVVSGLGARNIGSAQMSGRIAAIAGYTERGKSTLYVGAASGGVWKSEDGGTTFKPMFDKQRVQSIGAIAIDPSNPKNVWVGSGESWTRNSTSIGDGIYKSTDGGSTWNNVGLPESERITRILVHPKNPDVVYACVPGKLWSDSADRGVYKTEDAGKTWSLVLKGPNLSTGCSGLSMDPKNPEVLIAGTWDFRRTGWGYRSGGDGPDAPSASALYRTADGGRTWSQLTGKGLPPAPWGRVEVAIAPSDAKVVYAFVESKSSALFRSSDGGATWEERDKSQNMVWRPFYFARLVVDPSDPNRVFKPDANLIVSDDGGRSFTEMGGGHGDWHDVWVDPTNTQHIVGGDDGGLFLSYDGGNRWWKSGNLPISQFYHVSVDARDPYQVYGGLQDNSAWVGDSAYPGGITNSRWENLYFGDGFWTIVDPTDPDAVYTELQGGFVGRVDRRTHSVRDIQPKAGYKEKLRFNWNTPLHASPTQKGTIYIGAQFLFRSRDRGDTWERISPDLTTNDPEKQKQEQSGGVTVDNSSAEMHTTIYSIAESPKAAGTIWVGTDDGNLQITRDAGKTWTNVVGNVQGLPKASWVSWVEASRYDAGTAYAAFDRHTFGDMAPYVYKTTDFGKTWTRLVGPDKGVRGYAHVVREDTVSPKILFAGTELGLWISIDGGATWAEFKPSGFPAVAVRDLAIHARDNDLVIATHGRGLWIVDDITPLRVVSDNLAKDVVFLPGRATQQRMPGHGGWVEGDATFIGQNPSQGAVVTYYQKTRHLFGRIKLEVLDETGKVIDTITPTKRRGINRVAWSMRVKAPRVPRAAQIAFSSTRGPRVLPGTYTLRLTKGTTSVDTKVTAILDRRAPFGAADRKAQFEAVMRCHALFGDMSTLVDKIDSLRGAAETRAQGLKAGDPLAQKLEALQKKLDEAKKKIVATKEGGAITGEERIREHLDHVYGAVNGWEGRPARYQIDRIDALKRELADVTKEVDEIVAKDVRPLELELRTASAVSATEARCIASRGEACEARESLAREER